MSNLTPKDLNRLRQVYTAIRYLPDNKETWFIDRNDLTLIMIKTVTMVPKETFTFAKWPSTITEWPRYDFYIPLCKQCKRTIKFLDGVLVCEDCDRVIENAFECTEKI